MENIYPQKQSAMNWMKHYSKAGLDMRMQNVINDMGYFGVGLYWTLCERIECRGEGSYPRKQLIQELKSRRLNSRHIHKLLDEYNLFFTSPEGTVSLSPLCPGNTKEKITSQEPVLPHEPTPQQPLVDDEPTSQQPSVHDEPNPHGTSVQTAQGARVIKRNYKERDYKERIYNNTNLPEWILKQSEQSWYPYIAPLLYSEQAAWREVVCMQSGYGTLLMRHWETAIGQFALHITAYGTGRQIRSINDAQYYFNSFVKLTTASGKTLKGALEKLEACLQSEADRSNPYLYEEHINGIRYANGCPIPSQAPPRPSPSAVWDDASDTWNEFY